MNNPTKRTAYELTLELLSLFSLLWALYPILFYNTLSEDFRFPIHYNGVGEIDGWAGRSAILYMQLAALVIYLCFFFVQKYLKNKNIYRLIGHLKFIIIVSFAYMINISAIGAEPNKLVLYAIYIALAIAIFMFLLNRKK